MIVGEEKENLLAELERSLIDLKLLDCKNSRGIKQMKALIHHIELAERGAIQEDCIMCRKKDLHDYRGILGVIEKQHKRLEDLK